MELMKVRQDQWNAIKEIYMEAFPKRERKPFFLLKSKKVEIFTAVDKGKLLGFTAVIPLENLVMVDYLAVNSKIRSQGTGGFIMRSLCEMYRDKKIVLLIEKVEDTAENKGQRIARRRFYIKNGFTTSGLFVNGVSGTMEILNYGGYVQEKEYLQLQKHALGKWMFKLSHMKLVSA